MPFAVYVAAPYAEASEVRQIHKLLRGRGFECTSSWAEAAEGPELLTPENAPGAIAANDRDLERSDVVLALVYPTSGGEMFCEMTRALTLGKRVVYHPYRVAGHAARTILSAYRPGVTVCSTMAEAYELIGRMARGLP